MRKKINIALIIINVIIILAAVVAAARAAAVTKDYISDDAKKCWDSGPFNYGQISLFTSPESAPDITGVYSLKNAIDKKLVEKSVSAPDDFKGRLWIDCWYAETRLTIKGNSGNSDVVAAGTGGDFFIFHPFRLLYGNYYSDDDLNFDTVIIDKECSWQLFGSINTVGMTATINNMPYKIVGVIDSPDDKYGRAAYGKSARIYIPYHALERINPNTKFTCYEACLPDVVDNFAADIIKDVDPVTEDQSFISDQTGRFEYIKLYQKYKKLPENSMVNSSVSFPWFENAIRAAEMRAMLMVGPVVPYLLIPAFTLVYVLFNLTKLIGKIIRKFRDRAEEKYEKRISEEYYKTHPKEQTIDGTD